MGSPSVGPALLPARAARSTVLSRVPWLAVSDGPARLNFSGPNAVLHVLAGLLPGIGRLDEGGEPRLRVVPLRPQRVESVAAGADLRVLRLRSSEGGARLEPARPALLRPRSGAARSSSASCRSTARRVPWRRRGRRGPRQPAPPAHAWSPRRLQECRTSTWPESRSTCPPPLLTSLSRAAAVWRRGRVLRGRR